MIHTCKNCRKEYDCKIDDCEGQKEFGFCSTKCTGKYLDTHPDYLSDVAEKSMESKKE